MWVHEIDISIVHGVSTIHDMSTVHDVLTIHDINGFRVRS